LKDLKDQSHHGRDLEFARLCAELGFIIDVYQEAGHDSIWILNIQNAVSVDVQLAKVSTHLLHWEAANRNMDEFKDCWSRGTRELSGSGGQTRLGYIVPRLRNLAVFLFEVETNWNFLNE
jgi:hypothetical protein